MPKNVTSSNIKFQAFFSLNDHSVALFLLLYHCFVCFWLDCSIRAKKQEVREAGRHYHNDMYLTFWLLKHLQGTHFLLILMALLDKSCMRSSDTHHIVHDLVNLRICFKSEWKKEATFFMNIHPSIVCNRFIPFPWGVCWSQSQQSGWGQGTSSSQGFMNIFSLYKRSCLPYSWWWSNVMWLCKISNLYMTLYDYRAASFLRLWEPLIHCQQIVLILGLTF